MEKESITKSAAETQELGGRLATEILAGTSGSRVILLFGDLGAGKTTFTQGLLRGFGVEGPYTSPTFLIMKKYETKTTNHKLQTKNVYHIDAYRVDAEDIISLGWEEMIADPQNVIIVEWADRIEKIIPKDSIRIRFEWVDEEKRKIFFKN